jgi:GDP-4-dehydro-6-deoxy-D-mannose reductase
MAVRTALVTGAAGFSGRHLAARLRRGGSLRITGTARGPVPVGPDLDEVRLLDLTDATAVDRLVAEVRPDLVFHLAGRNAGAPAELHRANGAASALLLEAVLRHAPAARVLITGSAAEYGPPEDGARAITETHPCRPVSAYGESKLAATGAALDAAARGLHVTVARPFNIVGRGMPATLVIGAVLERARAALAAGRAAVMVGRLDTARDFVAVEDVVEAYARLVDADAAGQVVNICSGVARSIGSVLDALLAHAPRRLQLVEDPDLVRGGDVPVVFGSYERARQLIGFEPWTPLEVSLGRVWTE